MTQKYMPNIFEEVTIFAKNLEKKMYSPRDIAYISIEIVYFLMNQKDMATINWRQKRRWRNN